MTHRNDSSWTVSILSEYAEKGSLEEFLDIVENMNVNKVRSWTIELLDALRFLHEENGIIHEVHTLIAIPCSSNTDAPRSRIYIVEMYSFSGNQMGSSGQNLLMLGIKESYMP